MPHLLPGDVLLMRQVEGVWNTPRIGAKRNVVVMLDPGDTVLVLSSEITCPKSQDVFYVVVLVKNVVGYVDFYGYELSGVRKAFERIMR
jgi:hypothetical protein